MANSIDFTKVVALTSTIADKNRFSNFGLHTIDVDMYTDVATASSVIIFDEDGSIEKKVIKYLAELSCTIYYIYSEYGDEITNYMKSLCQYNIYKKDYDEIDVNFIMEILGTTKTGNNFKKEEQKSGLVVGASYVIEKVSEFLEAIDLKDEKKLTFLYQTEFKSMLKFKSLLDKESHQTERVQRESLSLKEQVGELKEKLNSIKEKHDALILSGRKLEEYTENLKNENIALQENEKELNRALSNKSSELAKTLERSKEQEIKISELINSEKNLTGQMNKYKSEAESLHKQIDTLSMQLNSNNLVTEDIELDVSTTRAQRIIHIKAIDMLPYVMYSISSYGKYIEKTHKFTTMTIIISPKDGIIKEVYKDNFSLLSSDVKYDEVGKVWLSDGYTPDIAKACLETSADIIILVDLTMKSKTVLTSCSKEKLIYLVNGENSIEAFNLNKNMCIAYNYIEGVSGYIPNIPDKDRSSGMKIRMAITKQLYTALDNMWR